MLNQNCIVITYKPIGYPIGPVSKLYEDNKATIKIVLKYRITTQSRSIDILITTLYDIHIQTTFDTGDIK